MSSASHCTPPACTPPTSPSTTGRCSGRVPAHCSSSPTAGRGSPTRRPGRSSGRRARFPSACSPRPGRSGESGQGAGLVVIVCSRSLVLRQKLFEPLGVLDILATRPGHVDRYIVEGTADGAVGVGEGAVKPVALAEGHREHRRQREPRARRHRHAPRADLLKLPPPRRHRRHRRSVPRRRPVRGRPGRRRPTGCSARTSGSSWSS